MKKRNKLRKIAYDFSYRHELSDVSLDSLITSIENDGFEIVEFNPNEPTQLLLSLFQQTPTDATILNQPAFVYCLGDSRILFVNEDLDIEEKEYAVAHEIGHIICGHLTGNEAYRYSVRQEYEANEVAHYLLSTRLENRIAVFLKQHKKQSIICLVLVLVLSLAIPYCVWKTTRQTYDNYYSHYYVVSDGARFHVKECFYISERPDLHQLTREEYESGRYTPCKVCIAISEAK